MFVPLVDTEVGVEMGVALLLGDQRTALDVTDPRMVCGSFFGSTNSTAGGCPPGMAGVLVEGGAARGVWMNGVGPGVGWAGVG